AADYPTQAFEAVEPVALNYSIPEIRGRNNILEITTTNGASFRIFMDTAVGDKITDVNMNPLGEILGNFHVEGIHENQFTLSPNDVPDFYNTVNYLSMEGMNLFEKVEISGNIQNFFPDQLGSWLTTKNINLESIKNHLFQDLESFQKFAERPGTSADVKRLADLIKKGLGENFLKTSSRNLYDAITTLSYK
ncbi:MAG: hypothetical protein ACD_63C00049G0001, partial [uncultured bacterium]